MLAQIPIGEAANVMLAARQGLDMSLIYSPRNVPASFFPRNPMISLAPKHNALWLMSFGYRSFPINGFTRRDSALRIAGQLRPVIHRGSRHDRQVPTKQHPVKTRQHARDLRLALLAERHQLRQALRDGMIEAIAQENSSDGAAPFPDHSLFRLLDFS
jgi:hypothetical protein